MENMELWKSMISHAEHEAWSFEMVTSPFESFENRVLDIIFTVISREFLSNYPIPSRCEVTRESGIEMPLGLKPCIFTEECGYTKINGCENCKFIEWKQLYDEVELFTDYMRKALAKEYTEELLQLFPKPGSYFDPEGYLRQNNLLEGG